MTAPPETIGPQLERAQLGTDPRGVLVFSWLPTGLQRAEDSTQAADRDRASTRTARRARYFEREATDAEKVLLEHLGYTLPAELKTVVRYKTMSVRHRSWPALGI